MVVALWRLDFFPHFPKKKIGPPYKLMIFSRFPPQKIFPYHLYPNETWYTCSLWSTLYDVCIFSPIFPKKKSAPPYKLAIFSRFPPKLIIIYHSYPNETWYTYSLLTSLYDVLILGPIFEKKIPSPSWTCNFFGDPQLYIAYHWVYNVHQWNLLQFFPMVNALWHLCLGPHFLKKKLSPPTDFNFFRFPKFMLPFFYIMDYILFLIFYLFFFLMKKQ